MSKATVRVAGPEDADTVISLIEGLAAYEKLTPPDEAGKERLRREMCSDPERLYTIIAEVEGKAVGYACAFEHYSTFEGLPKFFLEDIFVWEESRSSGAGFALFQACVREGARRGCRAMEWEALTWNRLAIDFYERLGAEEQSEWRTYRLDGEAFRKLAG